MKILPQTVQEAIKELSKLPSVGHKTATRLAFYLLNRGQNELDSLAQAVGNLKKGLIICDTCCNIAETNPCKICSNSSRNMKKILVVEDPMDVIAFENTNRYDGTYHVLHGVLSPIDGIGPDELRLRELFERITNQPDSEIIIATNPSLEGEATARYIKDYIRDNMNDSINVTRIAKGLPVGGDLEYADSSTLTQSLEGRGEF